MKDETRENGYMMKSKNWILITLAAILVMILGILLVVTKFIPSHRQHVANREYFEIYYQKAETYVREETNAIELHGDNFYSNKRIYSYSYEKEYAGLSDKEKTPHSLEEFNQMIAEISMRVYVNRDDACVVLFQKNSEGDLVVVDWHWDKY